MPAPCPRPRLPPRLVLTPPVRPSQTRNPADTSYLELSFYNLTYRAPLTTVQFDKTDYTIATATVSVPSQFANGGYGKHLFARAPRYQYKLWGMTQLTHVRPAALVVQQLDKGNQLYEGDNIVFFTR